MASQTQGVQQLLAAEKKAAEKVAEARRRKIKRLKQAKDEAHEEIENYRREREANYKLCEEKLAAFRETIQARIERETRIKLEDMERAINSRKGQVIEEILQYVYKITPEIHKNYSTRRSL